MQRQFPTNSKELPHQFAGLTKQHEQFEQRAAEIAALVKDGPNPSSGKGGLFTDGRNLTREEFKKWAMFQPLVFNSNATQ